MKLHFIRTKALALAAVAFLGAGTWATPLDRAVVPEDAKWVVHLDMDAFKRSKVGAFITDTIATPKLEQALRLMDLQISIAPANIAAITAYSTEADKREDAGVFLIKTTADVRADLEKLKEAAAQKGKKVTLASKEPYELYNMSDDFYIAPNIQGWMVLGQRPSNIEKASKVLQGQEKTLAQAETFKGYPPNTNAFFIVLAEEFDQAAVPPQAQILRESTGARLIVGEEGEKVFAHLTLQGRNADSATKIQQVLQGLVALLTLNQDQPEIADLARHMVIMTEGQKVNVVLNLPVQRAIRKIADHEGIEHKAVEVNQQRVK